ncbi:VOC family protein [Burkholderia sp. R-70006]|nr:VOC family protein [Burkholderia sp. R-70006]
MTMQTDSLSEAENLPMNVLHDLVIEIDHVALAVEDLDSALRWHCGALGFREVERRVTASDRTGMRSAVLQAGRSIVVLVQGIGADSHISRFIARHGQGIQHIALAVSDLDAAIERLRIRHVLIDSDVIAGEGIRQVFVGRDPSSDVRYELIERRGGSFNDRTVRRLFLALERDGLY